MESFGFEVTLNVGDTPNSFEARFGSGNPVIGFLAEYDALKDMSQEANALEKRINKNQENGHACGHNLLGTAAILGALYTRDYLVENRKEGTIVVLACPAEESGYGKAMMTLL